MRLEHHLVGGYVRYISPHIIIIIKHIYLLSKIKQETSESVHIVHVNLAGNQQNMLSRILFLSIFSLSAKQLYEIGPWLVTCSIWLCRDVWKSKNVKGKMFTICKTFPFLIISFLKDLGC